MSVRSQITIETIFFESEIFPSRESAGLFILWLKSPESSYLQPAKNVGMIDSNWIILKFFDIIEDYGNNLQSQSQPNPRLCKS